jgi:hypothetical protein
LSDHNGLRDTNLLYSIRKMSLGSDFWVRDAARKALPGRLEVYAIWGARGPVTSGAGISTAIKVLELEACGTTIQANSQNMTRARCWSPESWFRSDVLP